MKGNFKRGEVISVVRPLKGQYNRFKENRIQTYVVEDIKELYKLYPKMEGSYSMIEKVFEDKGEVVVYDFLRVSEDYINFIN